jgi:hypothetical protein
MVLKKILIHIYIYRYRYNHGSQKSNNFATLAKSLQWIKINSSTISPYKLCIKMLGINSSFFEIFVSVLPKKIGKLLKKKSSLNLSFFYFF